MIINKNVCMKAGVRILSVMAVAGILGGGYSAAAQTAACDSGESLSYNQAVEAQAAGLLIIDRGFDLVANSATVTVTNNTTCSVPVSLSSYKMYGPYSLATLSEQEFFAGTATELIASSSAKTLSIPLPTCMSQYDLWYGDVLLVIPNNVSYGKILSGDQVRLEQYCLHPVAPVVEPTTHNTPQAEATPVVLVAAVIEAVQRGSGIDRTNDLAIAPVVVSTTTDAQMIATTFVLPGLPDTGFGPGGKSVLLNFLSAAGIILLIASVMPELKGRQRVCRANKQA